MKDPNVFWINLDSNSTRREHMRILLSRLGLPNTRVSGITPDQFPSIIIPPPIRTPSPGELGCTLSHFKAMWTALKEGKKAVYHSDEYFVVMEDDVVLPYPIDFNKILSMAPKDYDVLQLFTNNYNLISPLYQQGYIDANATWGTWNKFHWSTLCYIIKYNTAKKLLLKYEFFNTGKPVNFSKFSPVDDTAYNAPISDLIVYHTLKTYTLTIPIMHALDIDSHIHPDHLEIHKNTTAITKTIMNSNIYLNSILPKFLCAYNDQKRTLNDISQCMKFDIIVDNDIVVPLPVNYAYILNKAPEDWKELYLYTNGVNAMKSLLNIHSDTGSLWEPWFKKYKGGAFVLKRINEEQFEQEHDEKEHDDKAQENKYVLTFPIAYCNTKDEGMRLFVNDKLRLHMNFTLTF